MKIKGQCCGAMVALAVQSPRSQRVLSRLKTEKALLGIMAIVSRGITNPEEGRISFGALLKSFGLSVRIRPALLFIINKLGG